MLHVERYTSAAPNSEAAAAGLGRFRVPTRTRVADAQISPMTLDEIAEQHWNAQRDEATAMARQEASEEAALHAVAALNEATDRLDEARERAQEALSAD
ncbi:MAG: hypothetical protein AAGG01_00580, partial [Planctomycetota bacterium]